MKKVWVMFLTGHGEGPGLDRLPTEAILHGPFDNADAASRYFAPGGKVNPDDNPNWQCMLLDLDDEVCGRVVDLRRVRPEDVPSPEGG